MTFWTLFIMAFFAVVNAYVGVHGVPVRVKQEDRLWANDKGTYIPVHLRFSGFYRGCWINVGFAGFSVALFAIFSKGEPTFLSREAMVGLALLNFISGAATASVVSSDFNEELVWFRGSKFWRVLVTGVATWSVYFVSGVAACYFVSGLKA